MDVPTHKIVGIVALASSVTCGIAAFVMSRVALRAVEEQQVRYNVSYFLDHDRVRPSVQDAAKVAKPDDAAQDAASPGADIPDTAAVDAAASGADESTAA